MKQCQPWPHFLSMLVLIKLAAACDREAKGGKVSETPASRPPRRVGHSTHLVVAGRDELVERHDDQVARLGLELEHHVAAFDLRLRVGKARRGAGQFQSYQPQRRPASPPPSLCLCLPLSPPPARPPARTHARTHRLPEL